MNYFTTNKKYLYASPVGKNGKKYLKKIIEKFGNKNFDYLIFVYDDTKFQEKVFQYCRFIYEKGLKWYFMKKYLIPKYLKKYEYIFLWDDDIDIINFSYKNYINIIKRNKLEISQPALSLNSFFSLDITLQNKEFKTGRFTNYIELMVPVYTIKGWKKSWKLLESGWNYLGWGIDILLPSIYKNLKMGIIDSETIYHIRKVSSYEKIAPYEMKNILKKYKKYKINEPLVYGELK